MSREYRELSFAELCDRLCQPRRTLIIFHDRPDGDATGSAFALRELLVAMGSVARCVCSCELHHRTLFAFENLQDGVLPETIPADFNAERIITVDTASPAQMSGLGGIYDGKVDIMIDHHATGERYADSYVVPDAAATGEIIYDISRELLRRGAIKKLPEHFSMLTYIAIATDTGCFKFSNTTPETHRRVAGLMDGSFDYARVNFRLFDSRNRNEMKVSSAAMAHQQFFCDGRISIVAINYDDVAALEVPPEYLDGLIGSARSVEGVEIAISLRQPTPEPVYRVSTRSNGDSDVAALCALFGGGGHAKAAGCTLSGMSFDEAVSTIVNEASKLLD